MNNSPCKCPKCRRAQYAVCSNPDCVCHKRVPKGKLTQIDTPDGNHLSCPYCGFTESYSYWEVREVETLLKNNGVHSFGELFEAQP